MLDDSLEVYHNKITQESSRVRNITNAPNRREGALISNVVQHTVTDACGDGRVLSAQQIFSR